jgi:putative peptidoglycan lipid II flippase
MSEPAGPSPNASEPFDLDSTAHEGTITRGATVFGSATLLSRVLGLGRDMLFADIFGTSLVFSAFTIAYQVPNMFRKLFGEGALSGAFVPVLTQSIHEKGEESGFRFAGTMFTLTGLVLLTLIIIGIIVYQIIGWALDLDKIDKIVSLGQMMLPYLFFICLAGLGMGVLNTYSHFAVPALSPALLNIVLIATMLWLLPESGEMNKAYTIAGAILVGGMLQLGVQVPILRRKGFHFRPSLDLRNPYLRQVLVIFLPGLFSLAITQVNVVLDSLLSFARSERAPAELAYANRLLQLPLGLFSVGFAAATLPALSKLRAAGKMGNFKKTLSYSLRQVLAISIPATVGLIILSRPIYRLLFEHGRFTSAQTVIVSRVMVLYAVGLFAYSANKILVPAFLSLQDSRTPMRLGVVSTLLNLGLNLIIVFAFPLSFNPYISAGFATTTAIAGMTYFAMLLIFLRRKIGAVNGQEILYSAVRICACAGMMGVLTWLTLLGARHFATGADYASRAVLVFLPMAVGITSYIILARLFRLKELRETLSAFRHRTE